MDDNRRTRFRVPEFQGSKVPKFQCYILVFGYLTIIRAPSIIEAHAYGLMPFLPSSLTPFPGSRLTPIASRLFPHYRPDTPKVILQSAKINQQPGMHG